MKKTLKRTFCTVFCMMFLTGCAASDGGNIPAMKYLYENEDYKDYCEKYGKGLISEDGYFINAEYDSMIAELTDNQKPQGDIAVTFSKNYSFDISYYLDPEMTVSIDTDKRTFNYEKRIYASEPAVSSSAPAGLVFDRFRIIGINENGIRKEIPVNYDEQGLVLKVPMDTSIKELIIEPLGRYETKTLSFSDHYMDTEGNEKELSGKWSINGDDINGDTYEIAANESCSVQYSYDPKDYYFVSSVPEALSENSSAGIVYFDVNADETNVFSVELRRYIKAEFPDSNSVSAILINGSDNGYIGTRNNLKASDKISVISADKRIYCGGIDTDSFEKISDGYKFDFIVPENMTSLKFIARDWNSKRVYLTLDSTFFDSINALGWFATDEDKLISVRAGDTEIPLKKLKNTPWIDIRESDELQIIASEDIKNYSNLVFEISVNGANPVYIGRSSESKTISLNYDRVENISINAKHGYVFSKDNIDNGDLDVRYYYFDAQGKKELNEGQFLEEGSLVQVQVFVPEGYEITGGAVPAENVHEDVYGIVCGYVEITDKTGSSDLVVNSRRISE